MTVWLIEKHEGDGIYDLLGTAEVRDGDDATEPFLAQVETALRRLAIDEVADYRVAPESDPDAGAVLVHLSEDGHLTEIGTNDD